jgi:DNA-directed RNA polymerase subunit RPC12/RpoP
MALIKCPDCSKDVSDIANHCLNCGRPIKYETTQRGRTGEMELELFDPRETAALKRKIVANESHGTNNREDFQQKRLERQKKDDLIANIKLVMLGIISPSSSSLLSNV